MANTECIFCRMVSGEIPAIKVYEDEQIFAFMDIFPVSRGHLLVIGKSHHSDLFDLPPDQLSAITLATQKLAIALRQGLRPDGLRVVQFNGEAAGQTVFHYHVHIRPAYKGQESRQGHGEQQASPEELESAAQLIRCALETA